MMASECNENAELEERREALQKFANANPDVPKGFTWGMAGNVLIGRFRDPAFVRGLQRTLRESNIPSMLRTSRFEAAVYVPELHRSTAFQILTKCQNELPQVRMRGKLLTRRYDLYFLYFLVSCASVSLLPHHYKSLPFLFSSIFTCIAAAWLFDRFQISQQWYGRHRFRLLDMLIIFAVIAAFLAAINF